MPPSIDPVTNIFGTAGELVKRIAATFLASWVAHLTGAFCTLFTTWEDLLGPIGILVDFVGNMEWAGSLLAALWPFSLLGYLLSAPLYALFLVAILGWCLIKIFFSDEPILLWSLIMTSALAPGPVLVFGEASSWVPLVFFQIGLGAGIWYALELDYPHVTERVKQWFDR